MQSTRSTLGTATAPSGESKMLGPEDPEQLRYVHFRFVLSQSVNNVILLDADNVAAANVVADVFLALLPTTIFRSLKLIIERKIGLIFLLSLGLITAVAGSIKMKFLASLNARSDLTCKFASLSQVFHFTISNPA